MAGKSKESIPPEKIEGSSESAKKQQPKLKRGHYRQKECPYCNIHVGNLGNHIRLKHPTKSPPVEMTKESLIEPGGQIVKTPGETLYYCQACHAELRKDENPCWHCGEILNWNELTKEHRE